MIFRIFTLVAAVSLFASSCSSHVESSADKAIRESGLVTETDSLAYIIGMSLGEQLVKMDSTINVALVCRAIIEQFDGEAHMSIEEAQTQYLRYLLFVEPERKRGYEETYLSDLATNDRKYTRTKSGLAYNIAVIGDESKMPKTNNDLVNIRYSISRINGDIILPKGGTEGELETLESALSDLHTGVQESLKMIGVGGRIEVVIPSKLAYGEAGDEELGIEPIETLRYTIELVELEKNAAKK